MIILDPVQRSALRKSAKEAIEVAGLRGTGKTTLANLIAVQSTENGQSCLLVGGNPGLDRPIAYQTLEGMHATLAARSQFDRQADAPPSADTAPPDIIKSRAAVDPDAARTAVRLLRRVREIGEKFKLSPDEVELSVASDLPISAEVIDLASLAIQDAIRLADTLWSGNGRAGRSLYDIDELLAGRSVEVPADEQRRFSLSCLLLRRPANRPNITVAYLL